MDSVCMAYIYIYTYICHTKQSPYSTLQKGVSTLAITNIMDAKKVCELEGTHFPRNMKDFHYTMIHLNARYTPSVNAAVNEHKCARKCVWIVAEWSTHMV